MKDLLYRQIEDALAGPLDRDEFEACAVGLLADAYPGLVPIHGGGDAGMDGAIPSDAGPPLPLVTTTAQDVSRNLRGSLNRYLNEGGEARVAVVATSQALTPARRRTLENRAKALGFTLRNIHDRADFTNRLHRDPGWRRRLLGLAGDLPALSTLPRSRRPLWDQALKGREAEVERVRSSESDLLIMGQPGSGKTAILAHLALQGEGLFLASDDMGRVADAVRERQPTMVFVDDAHRRLDNLVELRGLRDELGAEFSIVATAWPSHGEEAAVRLGVGDDLILRLLGLPRDLLAEIVRDAGVFGPPVLIGEILDQAQGRPGLAVALARACVRDGTADLATGESLLRSLRDALTGDVGEGSVALLGAIALGGSRGMELPSVAQTLGMSLDRVWEVATYVQTGGVLRELDRKTLAVEPAALRHALVRTVFFEGLLHSFVDPLVSAAPDLGSVITGLVEAKARGGRIPRDLIESLLERRGASGAPYGFAQGDSWAQYAWSGGEAVDWVLERHPERRSSILRAALYHRPEEVLPQLLEEAVGDDVPLNSQPNHPLRLIQDWVRGGRPGGDEALRRRRLVLDAVASAVEGGFDDERVIMTTIATALSPKYEATPTDPIDRRTIVFSRGCLTPSEMEELLDELWPRAARVLNQVVWVELHELAVAVHDWAFPGMLARSASDELTEAAHRVCAALLDGITGASHSSVGIAAWARRLAGRVGITLERVYSDPIFDVLFPPEDLSGDYEARFAAQRQRAVELGATWAQEPPDTIADLLSSIEFEAQRGEINWPSYLDLAAHGIAENAQDPFSWLSATSAKELGAGVVGPFIERALAVDPVRAVRVLSALHGSPLYHRAVASIVLRSDDAPELLLDAVIEGAGADPRIVELLALRGEVSVDRLLRLLRHPDEKVALAATIGIWADNKGGDVPKKLWQEWSDRFVSLVTEPYVLDQVFRVHPTLAMDWCLSHVETTDRYERDRPDAFKSAIAALDRERRLELIRALPADAGPYGMFADLVGCDAELYREVLERKELKTVHNQPLNGQPTEGWADLAVCALDAGYMPIDVVAASEWYGTSWSGSEAVMWREWASAFAALEDHKDSRIRETGRIGRERFEAAAADAAERERREDVEGW